MKVLVKETRACWVDFYLEVEIDDSTEPQYYSDAALDQIDDGGAHYLGSDVQDSLEFCDSYTEIVDSLPCNMEVAS